MTRRTGREGLYSRVIQNKREKFKQEQIQLEIEEYIPTVNPLNKDSADYAEPSEPKDFAQGISLGFELSGSSKYCPCGRYVGRCVDPTSCKGV